MGVLNRVAGSKLVARLGVKAPVDRALYHATRTGFTAANRTFAATKKLTKPSRLPSAGDSGVFDLTPTEEQRMIAETVREFAAEQVRPAAAAADDKCTPPPDLLRTAASLGITLVGVPESLDGVATERSTVTNVLVAEALAHGDLGLAVACLAPAAVSNALVLWGNETQQATYLPAFTGDDVPAAALAIAEPMPLFDPMSLRTKAYRTPGGFTLTGEKSLVPLASSAELFVVAADLEGRGPALFVIESSTAGLSVDPEPAMGLRAAATGRLALSRVSVPESALLGSTESYVDCVRLSRLAWCALAVGTGAAVLEYVTGYVNDRVAFGEPVSHRQGVAFKVADIGTELDGMRLLTYRAASRAEQGKPYAREVALARKLCAAKGMAIGSDGVQLLGGHGFVKEHPVERWYRDLRAIGLMEGAVLV
ncbi:acyl-CoA dehydrogenase family protein [Actinophytocola gossypii]|uniref:Acyl-CoA dehydrogenase family protein n=1 Tax=Actinophytocola gossypii TaxID=2812003 RepID=A0ABT2JEN2_9PSEU|nr:acyl-CoA dehydrogenase family protein [Actinophytocola gossypii]MCT2586343.1 acyl-CoA dehydrogenase family protein [Actinophytocola gossypii]